METSEQLNELFAALAAAQGEIETVKKTGENTFFKKADGTGGTYATLADCVRATHGPLSKNKLCFLQGINGGEFIARLGHASGQWLQIRVPVPGDLSKMNAQQLGSATTYLRRQTYSLIGLAPDEDDDGNEAAKVGTFGKPAAAVGIGIHSPLGEPEINDEVRAYADSFRTATDPVIIKQLAADLKEEGQETYVAVWSLLDSKTRSNIKRILATPEAA